MRIIVYPDYSQEVEKKRPMWPYLLVFVPVAILLALSVKPPTTESNAALPAAGSVPAKHGVSAGSKLSPKLKTAIQAASQPVDPKSCQPDTSYHLPTVIKLAAAPDGITSITDRLSTYKIYGSNVSQIEAQIKRCAPAGGSGQATAEFAAETSYNLTTIYSWTEGDSGQCHLTDIKVGLHINMVLPSWQTNGDAGLAATWATFIKNLRTHENGHVAIDQQYAKQLLSDLNKMPTVDCGQIADHVHDIVGRDIAALNKANDAYDARTNHGATQGAVL